MATYYIDFEGGNDSNSGLDQAHAWRHIPGTRNTAGSGRLSSSYGNAQSSALGAIVRITNPLPIGTVLLLKPGTTYNAANSAAGYIWIGDSFYELGATAQDAFVIRPDPTWGTGPVIFDGAGWTATQIPNGLIFSKADGLTIDGLAAGGIEFRNSPRQGFYATEVSGTTPVNWQVIRYVKGYGNGTYYGTLADDAARDTGAAANGTINMRRVTGMVVEHCVFDGHNEWINGVVCGDSDRAVTSGVIRDCEFYGHRGVNDAGCGIKAFNSQLELRRVSSHGNYKGADLGESTGSGRDITYKVIDSDFYGNSYGLNCNGPQATYAGAINFYAVNCLITGNTVQGMNVYAGPFNLHVVHCLFYDNGGSGSTNYAGHLRATPSHATTDTGAVNVRVFGCVFHSAEKSALETKMHTSSNNCSWESDYNLYKQGAKAEKFCMWSYEDAAQQAAFTFGANGPGHPDGNWQTWYGKDATPPAHGTGHFGCDVHSKGTGASDTTLPAWVADGTDWRLLAAYPGTSLAAKSWYIAEMGQDRDGATRTRWDIGPYEYASLAAQGDDTPVAGEPSGVVVVAGASNERWARRARARGR